MLHCIRAGDLAVEVVVYATFSLVTEFAHFCASASHRAFNRGSVPLDVRMLKH